MLMRVYERHDLVPRRDANWGFAPGRQTGIGTGADTPRGKRLRTSSGTPGHGHTRKRGQYRSSCSHLRSSAGG
jgi:hypothetical protein